MENLALGYSREAERGCHRPEGGVQTYTRITVSGSPWYRFWKRFFDILLSAAALVVLAVLSVPIALLVAAEDGFPIFFVQERNGLGGKVFRMYKFRSMCKDAQEMHRYLLRDNEMDGPAFKMRNDPRVTRVGRFLRRTSIDELPQLLNVLKGEMSIVGPRPLATYETEKCSEYQKQRMAVKPGLTCYWQCGGRNDVSFDQWIEMDLKYIREAGLWTDFKIILMTVKSVLMGKGAY